MMRRLNYGETVDQAGVVLLSLPRQLLKKYKVESQRENAAKKPFTNYFVKEDHKKPRSKPEWKNSMFIGFVYFSFRLFIFLLFSLVFCVLSRLLELMLPLFPN